MWLQANKYEIRAEPEDVWSSELFDKHILNHSTQAKDRNTTIIEWFSRYHIHGKLGGSKRSREEEHVDITGWLVLSEREMDQERTTVIQVRWQPSPNGETLHPLTDPPIGQTYENSNQYGKRSLEYIAETPLSKKDFSSPPYINDTQTLKEFSIWETDTTEGPRSFGLYKIHSVSTDGRRSQALLVTDLNMTRKIAYNWSRILGKEAPLPEGVESHIRRGHGITKEQEWMLMRFELTRGKLTRRTTRTEHDPSVVLTPAESHLTTQDDPISTEDHDIRPTGSLREYLKHEFITRWGLDKAELEGIEEMEDEALAKLLSKLSCELAETPRTIWAAHTLTKRIQDILMGPPHQGEKHTPEETPSEANESPNASQRYSLSTRRTEWVCLDIELPA